MKLKTVRVRRSNPSALALTLAMMLTMLCVYLISLSALPDNETNPAASRTISTAELTIEGMDVGFLIQTRTSNQLEARVLAARCADGGGAGLILSDGNDYCIISNAVSIENTGTNDLKLQADGLSLKLQGSSEEIALLTETIDFLRTLATETGGLAASIENGDTDLPSVCSLLEVYRTQGSRITKGFEEIDSTGNVVKRLKTAVHSHLARIDSAIDQPNLSKIKLIHAAACAEWISILEEFASMST